MKIRTEKTLLVSELSLDTLFSKGLEKEGLRVNQDLHLSQKEHAKELGSKLTHPYITTDYSESLLEFITPVFSTSEGSLEFLRDLHRFSTRVIDRDEEVIWNSSMPAVIDREEEVVIANYGTSNTGKLKELYREGLAHRYGRSMQAIAGIHYNISFNDSWFLKGNLKGLSDADYRSEEYFHTIRNYRRYSWLLVYLFGASPVVDESFLKNKKHQLKKISRNTYGLEFATSLRMGGLGYTSSAQESIIVCYNKLESYLRSIETARRTPFEAYEKIGLKKDGEFLQLNTHLLQIDNEFYSNIRPKRVAKRGQSALQALEEKGVQYLEVRLLDINPFLDVGIDAEEMDFIDLFLLYCLLIESPLLGESECLSVQDNFKKVVQTGLDEKTTLHYEGQELSIKEAAMSLLNSMGEVFADFKDANLIQNIIDKQKQKVLKPETLPAARILELLQTEDLSYVQLADRLSKKAKKYFMQTPYEALEESTLREEANKSWLEQKSIEAFENESFEEFLTNYFEKIKLKKVIL